MTKFIFILALIPHAAFASNMETKVQSALAFIESQQSPGTPEYEVGQWPANVTAYGLESFGLGRSGEFYDEPSAFLASSVANVLAEIYFIDNQYTKIPSMMDKAILGLNPYRIGNLFNFYPPMEYKGLTVRRPRALFLHPRWFGFTNIPPDADTSSVTHLMFSYADAIHRQTTKDKSTYILPNDVVEAYGEFRDSNRKKAHVYNQLHGYEDTGAFLTWLMDEQDPKMPTGMFDPPEDGIRIPFATNDVDCVVNVNVLKMLAATKRTDTPGYASACKLLNETVKARNFYFCGMYYPSQYVLPYGMASAIDTGVKCLEPSRKELLTDILEKQSPNGSWANYPADADTIQSTAWALNTLLLLGNPQKRVHRQAAQKALDFLLEKAMESDAGHMYWPGQIFYAATFVARQSIVWRSSSYTTAVVAKAFALADKKWKLSAN